MTIYKLTWRDPANPIDDDMCGPDDDPTQHSITEQTLSEPACIPARMLSILNALQKADYADVEVTKQSIAWKHVGLTDYQHPDRDVDNEIIAGMGHTL